MATLHHTSIVVADLPAAIEFFSALGLAVEGQAAIEGEWVDRINAIEGIAVDIVMMCTADAHGRLELTKFHHPDLVAVEPAAAPPNAPGLRSIMFQVDHIDDMVAALRDCGGELIGEIVDYQNIYRLCYLRGPANIIVALAEKLV